MVRSDFAQGYPAHGLAQRMWTFARHAVPPECCAGILASDDEDLRQRSCSLLRREHQILLGFESFLASSEARQSPLAKRLALSLQPVLSNPARLMMDAFE